MRQIRARNNKQPVLKAEVTDFITVIVKLSTLKKKLLSLPLNPIKDASLKP